MIDTARPSASATHIYAVPVMLPTESGQIPARCGSTLAAARSSRA